MKKFKTRKTMLVGSARNAASSMMDRQRTSTTTSVISSPSNFEHKKLDGTEASNSPATPSSTPQVSSPPKILLRSSTASAEINREPKKKGSYRQSMVVKNPERAEDAEDLEDRDLERTQMVHFLEKQERRLQVSLYWVSRLLPQNLIPYIHFVGEIVKIQRWWRSLRLANVLITRKCIPVVNPNKKLPLLLMPLGELNDEQRLHRRRYAAAMDFINYEGHFNNAMQQLHRFYAQPLREEAIYSREKILDESEVDQIFLHLGTVRKISESLLRALEDCRQDILDAMTDDRTMAKWTIGNTLSHYLHNFLSYEDYFVHYSASVELVHDLMDRKSFATFLHQASRKLKSSNTDVDASSLTMLLRQPIDHLNGYPQQVERILQETTQSHPDYQALVDVKRSFMEIGSRLSRQALEMERKNSLQRLQRRLGGDAQIVKPGRYVILSGEVRVAEYRNAEGKTVLNPRQGIDTLQIWKCHLVLLNDSLILMTVEQKKGLSFGSARDERLTIRKMIPIADIVSCDPEVNAEWVQLETSSAGGFLVRTGLDLYRIVVPEGASAVDEWRSAILQALPSGTNAEHEKLEIVKNFLAPSAEKAKELLSSDIAQIPNTIGACDNTCMVAVQVLEARNLRCPAVFFIQPALQVKVYIGKSTKTTSGQEKSAKPVWGETFKFHVRNCGEDCLTAILMMLDLGDEDKEPTNLGSVSFPLAPLKLDLDYCDWIPFKEIEHKSADTEAMEIRLSLIAKDFKNASTPIRHESMLAADSPAADLKGKKVKSFKAFLGLMDAIAKENVHVPAPEQLLARAHSTSQILSTTLDGMIETGGVGVSKLVRVPKGVDTSEWLLANLFNMYILVNQVFNVIKTSCTPEQCPLMSASPDIHYKWADGVKIITPIEVSAFAYVGYLNEWTEGQFRNKVLFPHAGAFPKQDFAKITATMVKKYFRIIAHAYYSHWSLLKDSLGPHFTVLYAYIYHFATKHKLLNKDTDSTTISPMTNLTKQIKNY